MCQCTGSLILSICTELSLFYAWRSLHVYTFIANHFYSEWCTDTYIAYTEIVVLLLMTEHVMYMCELYSSNSVSENGMQELVSD